MLKAVVQAIQTTVLYEPKPDNTWTPNWKYGFIVDASVENKTFLYFHSNAAIASEFPTNIMTELGGTWFCNEYPGFGSRFGDGEIINRQTVIRSAEAALLDVASLGKEDNPIFIVARSLGTGVASEIAQRHPHLVAGIILITPYTTMAQVFNIHVPLSGLLNTQHNYNCIDNVEAYTSQGGKVLIVAAQHDQTTPYEHSQDIVTRSPSVQLVTFSGGHNDFDLPHASNIWETAMRKFVNEVAEEMANVEE